MAPQYDLEVINDEPVYQSEQKEIDEANDILDNIEEPKIEMVIPETAQPEEIEVIEPEIVVVTQPEEIEVIEPEVVETKEEETPSEDEGIKKNS
jgi:hypothetical protein